MNRDERSYQLSHIWHRLLLTDDVRNRKSVPMKTFVRSEVENVDARSHRFWLRYIIYVTVWLSAVWRTTTDWVRCDKFVFQCGLAVERKMAFPRVFGRPVSLSLSLSLSVGLSTAVRRLIDRERLVNERSAANCRQITSTFDARRTQGRTRNLRLGGGEPGSGLAAILCHRSGDATPLHPSGYAIGRSRTRSVSTQQATIEVKEELSEAAVFVCLSAA